MQDQIVLLEARKEVTTFLLDDGDITSKDVVTENGVDLVPVSKANNQVWNCGCDCHRCGFWHSCCIKGAAGYRCPDCFSNFILCFGCGKLYFKHGVCF